MVKRKSAEQLQKVYRESVKMQIEALKEVKKSLPKSDSTPPPPPLPTPKNHYTKDLWIYSQDHLHKLLRSKVV